MYKFIQKNKKKLLAVFGVGLMIVFILPTTMQQPSPQQEIAFEVAGEDITLAEMRMAHDQWREVTSLLGPQSLGLVSLVAADIEEHPELFILLQKEARQLGIRVPESQVDEQLNAIAQQFAMFRRPLPSTTNLKPALHNVMLVSALFARVAEAIKPSEPAVMRQLAQNGQRVKLNLAHYSVDDFKKDIAAPTAEQLQKQFDDFKNIAPGSPNDQNPFGFGYQIPKQVKLQYLTVPRAEVARTVRQSKKEFEWKVQALLQYRANPMRFPSTQSTQPSTQPVAPTTKPFEEVQEQIINDLTKPEVDRKVDEIASVITERLIADFEAQQRKSAGAPADYGTLAHLQRIAADVEKRFGVKLGVSEINDAKSEEGLRELKGIGQSFSGEESFPQHVMTWAEPFVTEAQKKDAAVDVLSINEPSPKFRDADGNVYVFQIRDAQPAHAPADLNAVKDKVENDVRTKLAFDAALAAAKKLKDSLPASNTAQLAAASKAAGKDTFITPDFFDRRGDTNNTEPVLLLPGVDLAPAARQKLVDDSFELLTKATADKAHPSAVIELPAAGRVVVAELADVQRSWQDEEQPMIEQQLAQRLMMQRATTLLADYFKFDAVKQRLDFKDPNAPVTQTAAAN